MLHAHDRSIHHIRHILRFAGLQKLPRALQAHRTLSLHAIAAAVTAGISACMQSRAGLHLMLCLASISAEVEDALHRSRQGHKVALLHCVGAWRAQHTCDCMATSRASSLTKLSQARTGEGLAGLWKCWARGPTVLCSSAGPSL